MRTPSLFWWRWRYSKASLLSFAINPPIRRRGGFHPRGGFHLQSRFHPPIRVDFVEKTAFRRFFWWRWRYSKAALSFVCHKAYSHKFAQNSYISNNVNTLCKPSHCMSLSAPKAKPRFALRTTPRDGLLRFRVHFASSTKRKRGVPWHTPFAFGGGDGGTRNRVRKPIPVTFYERIRLFRIPLAQRQTAGSALR